MHARVLGSAAGGGFPQWNCGCRQCTGVRRGTLAAQPRTQASLAVSTDGQRWLLLGASPDVRAQIEAAPALRPSTARGSPIAGVALPNGDLDAWLGLLSLREGTPLEVLAAPVVLRDLEANPVMRTLERFPGHSVLRALEPGARLSLAGLTVEAVPAPGKPPVHMVGRRQPDPLDNVGLVVRDPGGASLAWFPSVAAPSPAVDRALREVDALFFDGTFWSDDELARAGVGETPARAMGHWPLGGVGGSLAFLARMPARYKRLVHVNNTNPILDEDSAERKAVREAGIEVAHDGLEWSRRSGTPADAR